MSETTTTTELALVEVVKSEELEPTQAELILGQFTGLFQEASKWEAEAKAITVTDLTQVDDIARARSLRLKLKDIRVQGEHARKSLKERILREGRVIDGVNNILVGLIAPLEEHLEMQEKFAERLEKEKLDKIEFNRREALGQYVIDTSAFNLRTMEEAAFQQILVNSRKAWEAEQEALRQAEQARLAAEEAEKKRIKEVEQENARLKKEAEARAEEEAQRVAKEAKEREEAEERERQAAADRKRQDDEREAEHQKELEAAAAREAEAKRIAEEAEQALALKAKQEAEAEAQRLADIRAAELAPDKDKLFDFAEAIKTLPVPRGLSAEAQAIVATAEQQLLAASQGIKDAIKTL